MKQQAEYLRKLVGYGGEAYFDGTTEIALSFDKIVLAGNTVITILETEDGNVLTAGDSFNAYNFTGKTLTSAAPPIYPPEGKKFTKIRCSTNNGIYLRVAN